MDLLPLLQTVKDPAVLAVLLWVVGELRAAARSRAAMWEEVKALRASDVAQGNRLTALETRAALRGL